MKPLLMEGGGGQVPPSTPVTVSDSLGDDEFSNIITFNYDLHNEMVDGLFQLPTTEDFDFSEKGWQ
jgi:hypothetical protein